MIAIVLTFTVFFMLGFRNKIVIATSVEISLFLLKLAEVGILAWHVRKLGPDSLSQFPKLRWLCPVKKLRSHLLFSTTPHVIIVPRTRGRAATFTSFLILVLREKQTPTLIYSKWRKKNDPEGYIFQEEIRSPTASSKWRLFFTVAYFKHAHFLSSAIGIWLCKSTPKP